MAPSRKTISRRQRGASLIEILIAVLILAIGLRGIAALQVVSLRNTQSAAERTVATMQTYAMFDMLRANRAGARAGVYNQSYLCSIPADATGRVDSDIARWIADLQENMGETACGSVTCGATTCTVRVRWNDARGSGGSATQELITESRL